MKLSLSLKEKMRKKYSSFYILKTTLIISRITLMNVAYFRCLMILINKYIFWVKLNGSKV